MWVVSCGITIVLEGGLRICCVKMGGALLGAAKMR